MSFLQVVILGVTLHFATVFGQERCLEKGEVHISDVNTTYNFISTAENPCTFMFTLDFSKLNDSEIMDVRLDVRVEVDPSNTESRQRPLMVSIRQQHTNTHIKLPYTFAEDDDPNKKWYYSTRRTLCFHKTSYDHGILNREETSVIISVDTYSDNGVPFSLTLERSSGLLMHLGEERSVRVNPMTTTYFRFEFEHTPDIRMIEIVSKSEGIGADVCTIIAIDDPKCPVYDIQENMARTIELKRMTRAAVTRLRKKEFPKGFTVIIIPLSDDEKCRSRRLTYDDSALLDAPDNPDREKSITLKIRETVNYDLSWMFGLQIIGIFIPCLLLTLIVFCCCDRRLKREYKQNIEQVTAETVSAMLPIHNQVEISGDDEELNYHGIVANSDTYGSRKQSQGYCTATLYVSVFYIIPVYQFLYYHWKSMSDTGDFDHCYYNELCRIRVEDLSDFNHLISNLLYIVFGLTFIIIVYWRSATLFNLKEYRAIHRGLCIPFGAYIALGMSLIMEGILSSAYHFCPSSSTFQFDVAFMYVIAVILLSSIHQLRFHASPSGTKAFLLLTVLTIMSAVFYVIESRWMERNAIIARLIFAGCHIIFIAIYCIGLYYHGTIKDSKGKWMLGFYTGVLFVLTPTRVRIKLSGTCLKMQEMKVVPHRDPKVGIMKKILYGTLFVLNTGASIHLAINEDFAHYLLNLLIFNVVLALISYIIWKVFYWKTRPKQGVGLNPKFRQFSPYFLQTVIYLTVGILFFGCAFRKFNINLTEWRATAAESRTLNQPCSKFWKHFYDDHDVWHFFSAVALFFFFMGLLTIDDGIILEDRRNIKIF